jgi:hypothetical protein
MLEVARGTRFTRPRGGGEAEVTWSLEIPPAEDVPEPVLLSADDAADTLATAGAATLEECGSGAYQVTAYIGAEGNVLGAGATHGQPEAEAALDCVSASLSQWQFDPPGSYPAKISFVLQ